MPELPEAETIVRTLRPRLEGRRIIDAQFLSTRVSPDRAEDLRGRVVKRVRRHGKRVLLELDEGILVIDLRMTGKLLWEGEAGPYTRALFTLDHGSLLFDDIRQFGSVRIRAHEPEGMGPDPFEIPAEEFAQRLRARNTEVKRILLDQRFIRGMGNIYADEALFRAGIHPKTRTRTLSTQRALTLHGAIRALLAEAIEHRGSSVSDYVDAQGQKGGFQLRHQVYRKEGQPCPRCGTPIVRIVVGQRGTHYCGQCQRRRQ